MDSKAADSRLDLPMTRQGRHIEKCQNPSITSDLDPKASGGGPPWLFQSPLALAL